MKHVGSLFENFQKRFKPPQASVEKRVAEIICEITPLTITPEQVSYTIASRTISLKIPSILKSELQNQKTAILDRLVSEMGVKNAPRTIL